MEWSNGKVNFTDDGKVIVASFVLNDQHYTEGCFYESEDDRQTALDVLMARIAQNEYTGQSS